MRIEPRARVNRPQLRDLLAAGMTPGCPDVEQNDLAALVPERDRIAGKGDGRVGGRRQADVDALLAAAARRKRRPDEEDDKAVARLHRMLVSDSRATRTVVGRVGAVQANITCSPVIAIRGNPLARDADDAAIVVEGPTRPSR